MLTGGVNVEPNLPYDIWVEPRRASYEESNNKWITFVDMQFTSRALNPNFFCSVHAMSLYLYAQLGFSYPHEGCREYD